MARGGKRVGTVGRGYSNRSDLQRGPRKPDTPRVAPASSSQPHGTQAAQLRSLQALPSAPAAPVEVNAPPANGTGAAPPAPEGIAPGSLPALDRPTERAGEPLTAGINSGMGPGAEALPPPPPTADPDRIRRWLPALEVMAEMPDASDETRNYVRYWRSVIPT